MQLDEFFAGSCEMLKRGADPERLREELECAIRLSLVSPDAMIASLGFDERVPPGEIRRCKPQ